jgi:Chaperone of endosialidase
LETTGTAADGKVLKLQAGGLAWADDLTGGAGGTAYSAGTGLALAGTTFSVANAGITRAMLATSGTVADGKVLKLSGGNLTWADDLAGAGGSTYSADGSSLSLNGTTFSVKDAGISASKLALPLNLNSSSGSPLFTVTNSGGNALSGISGNGSIGLLGRSSARGVVATQGDLGLACAGIYAVGGCATDGNGVQGTSASGRGVQGSSDTGIGVIGISTTRAVIGTQGPTSCAGVYAVGGCATSNIGVQGVSESNRGVLGSSTSGTGVVGLSVTGSSGSFVGGAGWVCTSDRNKKENFKAVNARAVLEKLAAMPVTRWNMKGDRNKTPHMGPVAQDFKAAFGLGESDKTINAADAQGVALAAIKGMYEKNQALEKQVGLLEARLKILEKTASSR